MAGHGPAPKPASRRARVNADPVPSRTLRLVRQSMAFFHQPNYDAVIECLPTCVTSERPARYGRTTSGEHVWMKITKHRAPELAKATA